MLLWSGGVLVGASLISVCLVGLIGVKSRDLQRVASYTPLNDALDPAWRDKDDAPRNLTQDEATKLLVERIKSIRSPGRILLHNFTVIGLFAVLFPWGAILVTRQKLEAGNEMMHYRMGLCVGPLVGCCVQLVRVGLFVGSVLFSNVSGIVSLSKHGVPELLGVFLFVSVPLHYYRTIVAPSRALKLDRLNRSYTSFSFSMLPLYFLATSLLVLAAYIEVGRITF